jgi:transcription antitermination factor NusG
MLFLRKPYCFGKIKCVQMSSSVSVALESPINQISSTESRWFAVYTKFKCEKFVAEQLRKKNIESYVPLIKRTKRYERKIKHYQIPLINCYVFVLITQKDYLQVLETEYVLKFLRHGKDLLAIPFQEIQTLKKVAGDVEEIEASNLHEFTTGEEVEVISGSLTGLKGKIIEKSGKKSFVVELERIGFQLRINIDLNLIVPVKKL